MQAKTEIHAQQILDKSMFTCQLFVYSGVHLFYQSSLDAFQAADYLEQAEYDTGNPTEDLKTQSLMRQLLHNPKLQAACPLPFDEAKLWKGQRGPELKQKIQAQFKNIRFLSFPLWQCM